jgi:hypothetical protein
MEPIALRTRMVIVAWEVTGLAVAMLAWTGLSVWLGRLSLGASGAAWFYGILGATLLLVGLEAVALARQIPNPDAAAAGSSR